jgi:uncharacterized protein
MRIVWDPAKARSNFSKHGIRFSDAEAVLFDPGALTVEDAKSLGEQRFITVGTDCLDRVVTIVYAFRADAIRLISAREATPKERKAYEEGV